MNEPSMLQVVLMGLITVFVVLICLIIIIKILGAVMTRITGKNVPQAAPAAAQNAAAPQGAAAVPGTGDKQKLVAAVAAAIAEDMGTDVNHLRIHSIRRL